MTANDARVDVLVVGGGPAGLTAAAELRRLRASVVVVEREVDAGGIPRHTDHVGYGMRDLHRVMSGPRYARRLVTDAVRAGVDVRTSTTVLALDGGRAQLVSPGGPYVVDARAVVLATGVRERPRAARLVPGDRPAGVVTTGAAQQFTTLHHERVGRRAVVVGAEHVSFSAVLTLRHAGCEVAAMVTPFDRHQTYPPLRWVTTGRRVPVRTGVDVERIVGGRRVDGVVLTDGTRIDCDTVVFTGDWIPDHELARRSGLQMTPVAKAPVIDRGFRTAQPGLFAIGNLVHPADTADICALDGRSAATSVAAWLESSRWPAAPAPITVSPPIAWASYSARGITLRVATFTHGRIRVSSDDGPTWTSRPRRLIPNRAITVPAPTSPATQVHVHVDVQ